MKIEKIEIATIFKNDKNSVADFYSDFSKKYVNFKEDNIIIDFSLSKEADIENILLFLPQSKQHKNNGMSFVMVVDGIDADDVTDKLITVPTLIEALDIVEMENIERDLGF